MALAQNVDKHRKLRNATNFKLHAEDSFIRPYTQFFYFLDYTFASDVRHCMLVRVKTINTMLHYLASIAWKKDVQVKISSKT